MKIFNFLRIIIDRFNPDVNERFNSAETGKHKEPNLSDAERLLYFCTVDKKGFDIQCECDPELLACNPDFLVINNSWYIYYEFHIYKIDNLPYDPNDVSSLDEFKKKIYPFIKDKWKLII